MISFRILALGVLLGSSTLVSGALVSGGCGGASSGPNSNTSAGLGTLFVSVSGGGDGAAVYIERTDGPTFQVVRPTRDGKASFYNIPPGRFRVSQGGFSSNGEEVNIVADRTANISLS